MKKQKKKKQFDFKYVYLFLVLFIVVCLTVIIIKNVSTENNSTSNIVSNLFSKKTSTIQDINIPLKVFKIQNDGTKDRYEETNTIFFEKGFATTITTVMVFEDEAAAEMMYAWQKKFQEHPENSEMEIVKDNLTITTTNTMKSYSLYYFNFNEKVTRLEIKKEFERNDYFEIH